MPPSPTKNLVTIPGHTQAQLFHVRVTAKNLVTIPGHTQAQLPHVRGDGKN